MTDQELVEAALVTWFANKRLERSSEELRSDMEKVVALIRKAALERAAKVADAAEERIRGNSEYDSGWRAAAYTIADDIRALLPHPSKAGGRMSAEMQSKTVPLKR